MEVKRVTEPSTRQPFRRSLTGFANTRAADVLAHLLIAAMLLPAAAWVMHASGAPFSLTLLDPIRTPIIFFLGPMTAVGLGLILAAAVFVRGSFGRFLPATIAISKRLLELGILVSLYHIIQAFAEWRLMTALPITASINEELSHLTLLSIFRLLVGRNINGLILVTSTVSTVALSLYVVDQYLVFVQQRDLIAHYEHIYGKPIDDIDVDLTRENSGDWSWGHPVVYNNLGFRSADVAVPKPAGTRRIMVLGDSLTWGAGLAVNERYTELLEERLQQDWPATRWEVVNFGVRGGPTVHESAIFADHVESVQPDFVIVGFCVNDTQLLSQNYSVERSHYYWLHNLIASLRHVGLTKVQGLLHARADEVLVLLGLIPSSDEALDRTYRLDSRAWQAWLDALENIRKLSVEAGINRPIFALLSQGIAADRPHHAYLSRWFDQAADAANAAGFVVVDPRPRFVESLTLAELRVNPSDGHPSIASNRLYADALYAAIEAMLRREVLPQAGSQPLVSSVPGAAEQ